MNSDLSKNAASAVEVLAKPQVQYAIPLPWEERHRHLGFANIHGLGLEIAAFCSGPALNDPHTREQRVMALKDDLRGWAQPLSYHGAFIDIVLHSGDREIAALSRRRIEADLATASELGCEKVVFHTGFNPRVPSPRYRQEVVDRHAEWWPEVLERFPSLTVCLENLYEPDA